MHESSETVARILTRTSGYLLGISTHSLQPYRGCAYGSSLCGAGCYVRHNLLLTRGQPWGSFLAARSDAAGAYLRQASQEQAWARRRHGSFSIFMSSATDPFPPQEQRLGVTRQVLDAMSQEPPDALIVQTHSPRVVDRIDELHRLATRCSLRIHLSIESDRDRLPGLPPPAASVEDRLAAAATLHHAGLHVVITCAPLLPIADPDAFFARVAGCADAVVLDHFIGGDGSTGGERTWRTPLPTAIAAIDPAALQLGYRDSMASIARRYLPGRVGLGRDGFAGRFVEQSL